MFVIFILNSSCENYNIYIYIYIQIYTNIYKIYTNKRSSHGSVRWAYAMPVCVLFVSSRSDIVFNPNAGAITDHSQSAKNIDLYFKSMFYVEYPGHRKRVLIFPNVLSKPGDVGITNIFTIVATKCA